MSKILKVNFNNNLSTEISNYKIIIDNDNLINRREFYNWNDATDYVNFIISDTDLIYIIVKAGKQEFFRIIESNNTGYIDNLYDYFLESISSKIFYLQNTYKGKEYVQNNNPFIVDSLIQDYYLLSSF